MVVRQFNLVKKICIWLVGWLESDSDEHSILSKVEHSSNEKKNIWTLRARHAPGILKNAALPFRTIEKIRQPREKSFGGHTALGPDQTERVF